LQKLWGVLWIRVLVSLIVAPVIMTFTFIASGDCIEIVTSLKNGMPLLSDLIPPLHFYPIFLGGGEVLIWPPLLGVELNSRRHGQPLPPGLYAAFAAVISAIFLGLIYAMVTAYDHVHFLSAMAGAANAITRVGLIVGIYIGSVLAGVALISPFAQRWRARQMSEARVEQVF
jgi:hypothetical protein